ncbi:type I-G CRISPR-associated RAMP protein Csb1/Cas7g [Streptosporangium minutum]|uniref:type I-G CRISPR-associated RAMP protein Csb1/Cas7g n=1 Tax=Streptosporangium minutum TaxID=569862 RepID=UPI001F617E38|nr:type I-U CRISPR-associated RAMP protein Csb1/Cas7u [Streptosporangium minutum]
MFTLVRDKGDRENASEGGALRHSAFFQNKRKGEYVVEHIVKRLVEAVSEDRPDAGVGVETVYRPAAGDKVMPPSFPGNNGPYLMETRWVDGEAKKVVVLDQVPSQANRVEEALLAARDAGRIQLPLFELMAETSRGTLRLTSLEFPHRYADAYLRDSMVDGVRFDRSEVGQHLRQVSALDVCPLYERDPGSLLFGAWDSHRKGRWPKFARIYSSSIVGIDPQEGQRKATRVDPLNLTGAIDDKAKAEADWQYVQVGEKKEKKQGQRLSEIGHGNIAPGEAHGGVSIIEARRSGWISLAAIERLRFGDASAEAAQLARATLVALALAGDRLTFGRPSVWLRSGCDLVRSGEILAFEQDGGVREEFALSASEAIEVFHELRDRAAAAGVVMATDAIRLEPMPSLAKAIDVSTTQAAAEE